MGLSGQPHASADFNRWLDPRTRLFGKQNRKTSYPIPANNVTNCQIYANEMHWDRNKKITRTIWVNRVSGVQCVYMCEGGGAAGKVLTLGLLTSYEIHPGFVFSSALLIGTQK